MLTLLFKNRNKDEDKIYPKFAYFLKYKAIEGVAPARGDLYEFVMTYISDDGKLKAAKSCYVDVADDGNVRLLKQKHSSYWSYPKWIIREIKECPEGDRWGDTPEEYAKRMFCWCVGLWDSASGDLIVRVRKHHLVASFCIDLLRTPYFFKDREITALTPSGTRKKIIHIVRTHERRRGNHVSFVKSHFRGERKFVWNGYDVVVGMPGHHFADPKIFTSAARVSRSTKREKKMISVTAAAEFISKHMDDGWRP